MKDIAILFLYHSGAPEAALAQNWGRLLEMNPGVPVVPIVHDGTPVLPGTVDVRGFPEYGWDTADKWKSCDTAVYRWFLNRRTEAERYAVIEWDTWSNCSVRDFYARVWDSDAACVKKFVPRDRVPGRPWRRTPGQPLVIPDWPWFRETPDLPEELVPHAMGMTPFACTMFSHRGLERMLECPVIEDVHAELRAGTMARWAGLEVAEMRWAARSVSWCGSLMSVSRDPGIYHPVKKVLSWP